MEDINKIYNNFISLKEEIYDLVKDILINYIENKNYGFSSRIKKKESLQEKLESQNINKISEINDIFGFTIIVPYKNIINSIEKDIIHELKLNNFNYCETKSTKIKNHRIFDFNSTRCYFMKKIIDLNDEEVDIKFEIQIKTCLEFSWDATMHGLIYKSVYKDWRRYRLASQLKASLENLDLDLLGFEELAKKIEHTKSKEAIEEELIFEKLKELESFINTKGGYVFYNSLCKTSNNIYNLIKNNKQKLEIIDNIVEYFKLNDSDYISSISLYQNILNIFCKLDCFNDEKHNYYIDQIIENNPWIKTIKIKQIKNDVDIIEKQD